MHNQSNRGFSLVELLAVVAIILILMALLIPFMVQMREKARGVTCLENLKQFGKGVLAYASDNDGTLTATISTGSYVGSRPWQRGWMGLEAVPPGMSPPRGWYTEYGVLKQYLSAATLANRIFRCPSLPQGTLGSGVGSNGIHDYTMFAAFCGARVSLLPAMASVTSPNGRSLRVPAPIFTEEEPAYGINDGFIDPDHTTVNRSGTWHLNNASNYFATDGSAHTVEWRTSPGPQVYAWRVITPNGRNVSLADVYGWGSWNSQ